jgi:hypothetical protein
MYIQNSFPGKKNFVHIAVYAYILCMDVETDLFLP